MWTELIAKNEFDPSLKVYPNDFLIVSNHSLKFYKDLSLWNFKEWLDTIKKSIG